MLRGDVKEEDEIEGADALHMGVWELVRLCV